MAKIKKRRLRPAHERTFDPALQVYDSIFKEWVQTQPDKVLPRLLEGVTYVETLDVERVKPAMRADRVYKVMYRGEWHILHLEFQTDVDENIVSRLLIYHAILYSDYNLPVISIIIYPFETTMAVSPWHEMSGDEPLVSFHFHVLPLWMLEAEDYIREHITCMYPLLPTMHGVTPEMLELAMEELKKLFKENQTALAQHFTWMHVLLERTEQLSLEDKAEVERSLNMYDPLWDNHPKVKEIKAQAKARAEAEAERKANEWIEKALHEVEQTRRTAEQTKRTAEQTKRDALRIKREAKQTIEQAKLMIQEAEQQKEKLKQEAEQQKEKLKQEAEQKEQEVEQEKQKIERQTDQIKKDAIEQARLQVEKERLEAQRAAEQQVAQVVRDMLVTLIQVRFPALVEPAQKSVEKIEAVAALKLLVDQITRAPNEEVVRSILDISA